jgi:hypothetical protein
MKGRKEHKKEHRKKARGGEVYEGAGSNVEKEADEKAAGGAVKLKRGGHVRGHERKHRLDRPGRKRGGSVGADAHPLTTANKVRNASGHDADTGDADEG